MVEWANKSALDSWRHGMRTDMEQQYRTEVASQAMRYQRKVMTGYVTYLSSEPWRQHLAYRRAVGKHLAGTEFTGGSESMLSSPLEEMKANEFWEKKAEEMMQQNLLPSSRKMDKIRKKNGASFEIHCMGTRREGKKMAFLATMDGERAVAGVDTYSEISLVDENKARGSWQRINKEPLEIHGVVRATMGDRVMIPVRMRHREEETMIEARLCATKHIPRGLIY